MPKHFFEDYHDSVIASEGIQDFVSKRSDAEAPMVLLLHMYETGDFGTGDQTKAVYTFEGKEVTVVPTDSGKLYISFMNE